MVRSENMMTLLCNITWLYKKELSRLSRGHCKLWCVKKVWTYSLICEVELLMCDKFSFLGHRPAVNVYNGAKWFCLSGRGKFYTNSEVWFCSEEYQNLHSRSDWSEMTFIVVFFLYVINVTSSCIVQRVQTEPSGTAVARVAHYRL